MFSIPSFWTGLWHLCICKAEDCWPIDPYNHKWLESGHSDPGLCQVLELSPFPLVGYRNPNNHYSEIQNDLCHSCQWHRWVQPKSRFSGSYWRRDGWLVQNTEKCHHAPLTSWANSTVGTIFLLLPFIFLVLNSQNENLVKILNFHWW